MRQAKIFLDFSQMLTNKKQSRRTEDSILCLVPGRARHNLSRAGPRPRRAVSFAARAGTHPPRHTARPDRNRGWRLDDEYPARGRVYRACPAAV